MNPQSQGNSSASHTDLPLKRKRGRPRKDESLAHGENIPATPAVDSMKKNKQFTGAADAVGDEMVGKVVSGVIEGSFDAGYLLKVRVNDTETHLRGVVFLPGRFTPVTASNDVAPEAKMYTRTEMPLPVPVPPSQIPVPVPSSEQSDKQLFELQHTPPTIQVKSSSSELQSSVPNAQEKQVSSNLLPSTDYPPPVTSSGAFFGGGVAMQKILESVTGSQSASIMPQTGHNNVTGKNDTMKDLEASITKLPNVNVEATEQPKAMAQSAPPVHSFPGSTAVDVEQKPQHQLASDDLKLNQVSNDEKIPNLESNQVPVVTEPGNVSAGLIETKTWTEKQVSPKIEEPLELAAKIVGRSDDSHLNREPHIPKVTATDSESAAPTGLPAITTEKEATPSECELSPETSPQQRKTKPQVCSAGDPNIMMTGSDSAKETSLPVTLFEREAVPSELKLAIDEHVIPRITEPHFCISPGVSSSLDCNLKDAVPSTEP